MKMMFRWSREDFTTCQRCGYEYDHMMVGASTEYCRDCNGLEKENGMEDKVDEIVEVPKFDCALCKNAFPAEEALCCNDSKGEYEDFAVCLICAQAMSEDESLINACLVLKSEVIKIEPVKPVERNENW